MNKGLLVITILGLLVSCTPKQGIDKEELSTLLKQNPDLVMDVLQENRVELVALVEQGFKERTEAARKQEMEQALADPKEPAIDADRPHLGNLDAPITIVEYSDFFCPYCAQGAENVKKLLSRYPETIRVFFKHLPLQPISELSARYFEAVALQDSRLAWVFQDRIFANQRELKETGEAGLVRLAAELDLDMEKLAEDVKSQEVKSLVESDMREAGSFGIRGTPSFLVNGIPLQGAVPAEEFERVIRMVAPQVLEENQPAQ
ncbi:MAG: DsbA family protein [Desulfovibrionales bacterium]